MLDLRSRLVHSLEQHDIESARPVGQMVPSQVLGRQADQFVLLLPVYGMNRSAEIFGPPGLHLDEHQHRSVFGNEIQFAQRGAEVLSDDPIAFPAQVALGRCLSFLPKEASGVKECHAIVRRDSRGGETAVFGSRNCATVCATGSKVRR